MNGMTERTALLLGEDGVERLKKAHVLLFGLGGVGSYVAEALARAGVGNLTLVDDDTVSESTLNRQLVALHSTLGQNKAQVAAARIRDINPDCNVTVAPVFYMPATAHELPFDGPVHYDYIVDAIDTVTAKLEIIRQAQAAGVPVISSMGTGNKLHPELLQLTKLSKTTGCHLARVMRKECRARGLKDIPVVYSTEAPIPAEAKVEAPATASPGRTGSPKKSVPGSVSFVPGTAGLILAGAVIRALAGVEE